MLDDNNNNNNNINNNNRQQRVGLLIQANVCVASCEVEPRTQFGL